MSKITLIEFTPGGHVALTPQAIMDHLQASSVSDLTLNANPAPALLRKIINVASRTGHAAVMTLSDKNASETLERLIKRANKSIDVSHISYSLLCTQIMQLESFKHTTSEAPLIYARAAIIVHGPKGCGKTLNRELIARHFHCTAIQEEDSVTILNRNVVPAKRALFLTDMDPEILLNQFRRNAARAGRTDDHYEVYTYEEVMARIRANQTPGDLNALEQRAIEHEIKIRIDAHIPPEKREEFMEQMKRYQVPGTTRLMFPGGKVRRIDDADRFRAAPQCLTMKDARISARGVPHGATMYAMGIAEGLAAGGKYVTLVVAGDDECRDLFTRYPFINWDAGRIQVRTIGELKMAVIEEPKQVLGYTEWVTDINAEALQSLVELDQWEHLTAILGGDQYDRFVALQNFEGEVQP